ncbi:MAG: tetratricopeptide repeat protein [Emcibacter sp.]|nr:tetratricopeptide repeat protein [Emcibacter sp.]
MEINNNNGALMSQKFTKTLGILLCGIMLTSCGGERRVDGEMPFDSGALMNMAESFLQAGDYGNAMRLYQRAANENPKHMASRLGLAKTYQALGATDAALNFYEQVLRIDPTNMEAKMGTGQMLITRNRPADAIPYLERLLKQDPKNHKIYNMLGLAHDLMGEQEDAQMSYGRGLTHEKDNISLLNNLALSFAFEEQYAPAIKLLSKAIGLDYTVTKAQQNLVLVYVLSGEEAAGRKIGAGIMTAEEMENNVRFYTWVKSLEAGERAQAIFLGIKNFSGNKEKNPLADIIGNADQEAEKIPDDPKKRQLMEVLKQDTKNHKDVSIAKIEKEPVTSVPEEAVSEKSAELSRSSQKIFRVQLGAYPNRLLAGSGWKKVKGQSKGLLEPYAPLIKLVTLADGRNLFRLFVDSVEEQTVAQTLCEDLQALNIDCLVLKTAKD